VHDLLTLLRDLPPLVVYVTAALIVMAETGVIFGLLVPGEATLLLVGFLAYLGTLRLGVALVVMMAAAIAGDALAFRSGRRYGPRLRASRFGGRVGEVRWRKADSLLERLSGRGVLVARWVAFARTLVPRLAGAAGMPYRRFVGWNVVGSTTWVSASVLAGYLAGTSYAEVSDILGRATGAVFALLACIVVIVLVGRWLGRNPNPVRALAARAGRLPPLRWFNRRYGAIFHLLTTRLGAGWALVINVVAGLALLLAGGFVLAWLVRALVDYSGLSVVDTTIAGWFARQRADDVDNAALIVISVLRGSVLVSVVALLALVLGWRAKAWRGDLVSLVGTAGAFLPLVILTVVADRLRPDPAPTSPVPIDPGATGVGAGGDLLPTQNTVVAASLCTIAWLLARHSHWPRAVAAWTGAAAGVVTVGGARLYLGWDSASGTVTSVLIGVLWTAVFMIAWATRDGAGAPPTAGPTDPTGPADSVHHPAAPAPRAGPA